MKLCKCGSEIFSKCGYCKSCANAYMRDRRARGLGIKSTEATRQWRVDNPQKYMFTKAKTGAKRRGIPFDLSVEDIIIPDRCPVFGFQLEMAGKVDRAPSIDRIDSSKGYTKDNIQIISWRANNLKGNGTTEEIIKLAEYLNGQEG